MFLFPILLLSELVAGRLQLVAGRLHVVADHHNVIIVNLIIYSTDSTIILS